MSGNKIKLIGETTQTKTRRRVPIELTLEDDVDDGINNVARFLMQEIRGNMLLRDDLIEQLKRFGLHETDELTDIEFYIRLPMDDYL